MIGRVQVPAGDGFRHVRCFDYRITGDEITQCGRRVLHYTVSEASPACHICLPHEAHPLAAVWRLCERFDARMNVGAGKPREDQR